MGYMIEISESKLDKMSELTEKMLKYGGKLMQCIEEMSESSERMGERHSGGHSSSRFGERYEDDLEREYNERRRRGSDGRYR